MKLRATTPAASPSPVSPRRLTCPGCATSASSAWSASSPASAWDQVGLGPEGAGGGGVGMGVSGGAGGFAGRWQDQHLGPFPTARPWFTMLLPTNKTPPQAPPAPYVPGAHTNTSSSSLLLGQVGRKPWQPSPDLSGGVICSHDRAAGEHRPAPNPALV